jgi:ribosomal protein S18 acetylase RimI-like enzyme
MAHTDTETHGCHGCHGCPGWTIRPAVAADLAALGRMGAELARLHHAWDPPRFMLPDDIEGGYRWWLGRELENPDAVVLVGELARGALTQAAPRDASTEAAPRDALTEAAPRDALTEEGSIAGYCYGRLEERDWNALLDAHAGLHDIWVDNAARRSGLGRGLAEAMIAALVQRGAPRIVLKTSTKNEAAQRLFASLGWRPTMIEMTRES